VLARTRLSVEQLRCAQARVCPQHAYQRRKFIEHDGGLPNREQSIVVGHGSDASSATRQALRVRGLLVCHPVAQPALHPGKRRNCGRFG
jgi:hypothetical protein